MKEHKNHFEVCNGHVIYLEHEHTEERLHEDEHVVFTTWESVTYIAEKAYDARDLGGLAFDGATLIVMRHAVPVPVLFLLGGVMLGIYLRHLKKRLEST